MGNLIIFPKSLATAASANNIAASQSPGTAALTLNGAAVTAGVATIDAATATNVAIGRRVILTSGGNDSGITFAIVGTNSTGNAITDVVTGASGTAAQSNLDFVTVSSITPSAAIASTITAGTNGVGSSPWLIHNYYGFPPLNVGFAVELVSGAVNFTVQHTYDNPNFLAAGVSYPFAFNDLTVTAQSGTIEGAATTPVIATRVLINSGTGVIRFRVLQAGVS